MIKVINALFVMAIAAPAFGNVVHECFNPGSDIGAPHIVDKIPDQSIGLTLTSATGPTKRLRKSVSFNIVEHTTIRSCVRTQVAQQKHSCDETASDPRGVFALIDRIENQPRRRDGGRIDRGRVNPNERTSRKERRRARVIDQITNEFDLFITNLETSELYAEQLYRKVAEYISTEGEYEWNDFKKFVRLDGYTNFYSNVFENSNGYIKDLLGMYEKTCGYKTVYKPKNVIKSSTNTRVVDTKQKVFNITVSGIALLGGESESHKLLVSLNDPSKLTTSSKFHRMRLSTSSGRRNQENVSIKAVRKKIKVTNNVVINYSHRKGVTTLKLRDPQAPKVGGITTVTVKYRQNRWIGASGRDYTLATKTYDISGGRQLTFTENLKLRKKNRKVYVEYTVNRNGSRFYQNGSSRMKDNK